VRPGPSAAASEAPADSPSPSALPAASPAVLKVAPEHSTAAPGKGRRTPALAPRKEGGIGRRPTY
jgi:hypothetical protein